MFHEAIRKIKVARFYGPQCTTITTTTATFTTTDLCTAGGDVFKLFVFVQVLGQCSQLYVFDAALERHLGDCWIVVGALVTTKVNVTANFQCIGTAWRTSPSNYHKQQLHCSSSTRCR